MGVVLPWSMALQHCQDTNESRWLHLQARGEVMEDDTSLWGCLSRVTDLKTGRVLLHQMIHFRFGSWISNNCLSPLSYIPE